MSLNPEFNKALCGIGEVKPSDSWRFYAIAVDRTKDYQFSDSGILEMCGGKIYDVLLYDECSNTYVCSLIPSYEMHYVYSIPESCSDGDREEVDNILSNANQHTAEIEYWDVAGVDHSDRIRRHFIKIDPSDYDEGGYSEALEDALEYVRCNPPF